MFRAILNTVPLPLLLIAAVALTLGVVLGLVWLIRRIVPATAEGFHAEVSAPMLGVVGALFGLLLAFVIIVAYQNFLDADANVSRESDALASIVRDSQAFPEPGGSNVRNAVGAYVRAVVGDEWPKMHGGNESSLSAWSGLDDIFTAFRTVAPRSSSATAFYDDSVRQLNATIAARRDRLKSAGGGLPRDIVLLLLITTVVIVGYDVLIGSPHFWFHALGPAAIAMVVAVSLVVLLDLSYPFSGDVAIAPDDFKSGALSQFLHGP